MCNVLLGCCIGDALGMPFESKLPNDPNLLNWDGKKFLSSESHKLPAGSYTDDGAMSCMVAQSLLDCSGFDPNDLSQRYVDWIFSGKARGFGKTTLMALTAIKNGTHWSQSGVVGSLGNGTAMRSSPYGIYFRNDLNSLINIVKIDSNITHASESAEAGAIAIALAAYYAVNNDTENLLEKIWEKLPNSKVKDKVYSLSSLITDNISIEQVLRALGTRANVEETVPSALYLFMKCSSYQEGVVAAIRAGFDTDTTASIVGSLFGAKFGRNSIPNAWIEGVEDRNHLIELDNQLYNRSGKIFFPKTKDK